MTEADAAMVLCACFLAGAHITKESMRYRCDRGADSSAVAAGVAFRAKRWFEWGSLDERVQNEEIQEEEKLVE